MKKKIEEAIKGIIKKAIPDKIIKKIFLRKWILAIKISENEWKYLENDFYEFAADPFIIKKDEKYYVFYEGLNVGKEEKGKLYVAELNLEKMELENKRLILEEKFHLSYPNVFEKNGNYYMIPETNEAGEVILYEAENFPNKWRKKRTLLNLSCVDFTFLQIKNIYYCFFSTEESSFQAFSGNLMCYYTEDLINGELKPIKNSEISNNPYCSRMAGNFIIENGKIYRLSQDCSRMYGEALNFHEVEKISQEEYREKHIKRISPPNGAIGIHTYTQLDDIEIIDAFVNKIRFFEKFKKNKFQFKLEK